MKEHEMKERISQNFKNIATQTKAFSGYGDIVSASCVAYENRWGKKMPESKKAILMNSLNTFAQRQINAGKHTPQSINSAVGDISSLENPLSMLFNLMSILIPNFAYTEAVGVQPMPTKVSPIFYPQVSAGGDRNGIAKGTSLLGGTSWLKSNRYTTNILEGNLAWAGTAITGKFLEPPILKNTVIVSIVKNGVQYHLKDDGKGNIKPNTDVVTAGSVNYATGDISITSKGAVGTGDKAYFTASYDLNEKDPALAVFEWESRNMEAQPYRLRSSYSLDNFYQAQKVLGYNIDEVMSSSIAGYINKEISCGVFDNLLRQADANFSWNATTPPNVPWAWDRLEILQMYIEASTDMRSKIQRSSGNVVVVGSDHIKTLDSLDKTVYDKETYDSEPIGPYVAGNLLDRFKIIKNQDYPSNKACMVYKKSDTDASYMVGVFLGLYATDPWTKDDLTVVQGMGTQVGQAKVFDDSIISLTITE